MPPVTGAGGLHVLMTTDAIGGAWSYSLDLAAGLAAAGARTTLAVLGPAPEPDQQRDAAAVPGLDLLVHGLPLDWLAESPAEIEVSGHAVAEIASGIGASLLHLNSPALAGAARFALPVIGICHSCLGTWWETVRGGPMPADFLWRTDALARGYRAADALVAPTHAFGAATARRYGLPQPPITVHNGRPSLPPRPSRGAPEDFAFTAGRLWDDGKNIAALDRAAARLPVPVLAAGPAEGPNGAAIALGHLRGLGRLGQSEVAGYLSRRPVFVSTALYEPFGLAVLEAAQAGCALVLSDIPTFRELWDGAADFVPPKDDAAIGDAMLRLLRDRERRRHFGVAARERARRYGLGAMTAGVLDVYRRVLPSAGAPAGRGAAA